VLYLDSSALVKLYFSEAGSVELEATLKRAKDARIGVFSSVLAYAEVHAGLARKSRDERLSDSHTSKIHDRFDEDWVSAVSPVDANISVLSFVRDILKVSPIRGADALHLASALWLRDRSQLSVKFGSRTEQQLTFVCSDVQLLAAAEKQRLLTLNPERI
jgi:predicted nucleic acid-binding protein